MAGEALHHNGSWSLITALLKVCALLPSVYLFAQVKEAKRIVQKTITFANFAIYIL